MIYMDSSKLMNNRVIFGRICILASIIAIVGIFDTLISSYRKPNNDLDIITGRSLEVVGKIYGNVKSINDIGFTSNSPELTISFDEKLFSGYWLGEGMWRGELNANSYLQPGKYSIKIIFSDLSDIKPEKLEKLEKLCTYTVNVYSDAKTLRQSDLSFIKRFTGISPWSISIAFLPIILISGGLVFIVSGKIYADMAQKGFAEIYRVIRHERGFEIFFGLGKNHGLEAGERLNLVNESGDVVSEIVVENIGKENSSAITDISKIRPGCMVARIESL
jgi:hypothetical protein